MAWHDFDGKPYGIDAFRVHLAATDFGRWRKKNGEPGHARFIVLHNTAGPTLAEWIAAPPAAQPAQRIADLQTYYEKQLGWGAGPHLFIGPDAIWGFSALHTCGTHCSCWNDESLGIEMVGDFASEEWNSGPGLQVQALAIQALAALHLRLGLRPNNYQFGVQGLHFHKECKRDNHACPGARIDKATTVSAILAEMDRQGKPPAVHAPAPPMPAWHTDIWATTFATCDDVERSAYTGKVISPFLPAASLPARLPAAKRRIMVRRGALSVACPVVDVGPWYTSDFYWDTVSGRPRAEAASAKRLRSPSGRTVLNPAGIDLTPAARAVLELEDDGPAKVDWQFA